MTTLKETLLIYLRPSQILNLYNLLFLLINFSVYYRFVCICLEWNIDDQIFNWNTSNAVYAARVLVWLETLLSCSANAHNCWAASLFHWGFLSFFPLDLSILSWGYWYMSFDQSLWNQMIVLCSVVYMLTSLSLLDWC